MSNLVTRLLSALVAVPLLIYLFHKGGTAFIVLIELVILIGITEYYNMVNARVLSPQRFIGTAGALVLGLVATSGEMGLMGMWFTVIAILILVLRLRSLDLDNAITGMATTLFGVVYMGWLLSHAMLLRFPRFAIDTPDLGFFFIIMAIAATFMADAGAYFTGRAYGQIKLSPLISPNKTKEGALGGIIGGTLGVVLCKLAFDWFIFDQPTGMPLIHCLLLGPLLVGATIAGDLAESMMKRDAKIKDSGNIIPGHGGIMDRLDSILFALPVVYYYLKLFVYKGLF